MNDLASNKLYDAGLLSSSSDSDGEAEDDLKINTEGKQPETKNIVKTSQDDNKADLSLGND